MGDVGEAGQAPGEDFAEAGGAVQFAVTGRTGEKDGGIVAGCFRGCECGGEGGPAGFGEDLLGQVREGSAHDCPLPLP